jgi:hypothetical protein
MLQFPPMSIDGIVKELEKERNRTIATMLAAAGISMIGL